MKTAMQSLITHLEMLNQRASTVPVDSLIDIIETSYLNLEKEQIIETYEDGKQNGMDSITNIHMYIIGEKYYNQTYNQDK